MPRVSWRSVSRSTIINAVLALAVLVVVGLAARAVTAGDTQTASSQTTTTVSTGNVVATVTASLARAAPSLPRPTLRCSDRPSSHANTTETVQMPATTATTLPCSLRAGAVARSASASGLTTRPQVSQVAAPAGFSVPHSGQNSVPVGGGAVPQSASTPWSSAREGISSSSSSPRSNSSSLTRR